MRIKLLVMSILLAASGDAALAAQASAASGSVKPQKERHIQLEQYWKIKPGMTRRQIVDMLGPGVSHDNRLNYTVRIEQAGKAPELRPVELTFEDDKLSKIDSASATAKPAVEAPPPKPAVAVEPSAKEEVPVSSKPVASKPASQPSAEKRSPATPEVPVASTPVMGNAKASKPTPVASDESKTAPATPVGMTAAEEDVWHTVQDWAAAWSARDSLSFLAFYDNDFRPEEGISFTEWRKQRREYFRQVKLVEVLVSKPNVTLSDARHATVKFSQAVRSDQQRGESEKQFQLAKVGSLWMITAERTLSSHIETPVVAAKEVVVTPLPPTKAPEAPPVPDTGESVWKTVEIWAKDWSARDADAFIGHYDKSFRPDDGSSMETWSKRRRDYFKRVKKIEVGLSDSEVELTSPGQAEVHFTQAFRSDVFKETARKALTLSKASGQWKIVTERTLAAPPAVSEVSAPVAQATAAPTPIGSVPPSKIEIAKAEAAKAEAARIEADRLAAERAEAAKQAAARVEAEKIEAAKAEAARIAAAKAEVERAEAERIKAAKLAAARIEAEKVEAAKAEAARIAAAKTEADRAEAERTKAAKMAEQRATEAKAAAVRLDAVETEVAKAEAARVAAAKAEAAKAEAAKAEAARIEAIKAEAARVAAARAEAARLEAEKEAAARAEAARREAARIEAAKAEAAKAEAARAEAVRIEAAKAEAARIEAAKAEAARIEAARIEAIKAEAARAEAAKAEAARAEAAKAEADRIAAARAESAARIEAARQEALRAESARIEASRIEAAKADLLRMELQRAQVLRGETTPSATVTPATVTDPAAVGLEAWNAVQGWADAWMARNAAAFLGYYAPSFAPEDGSPRQAWEDRRKQYFDRVKQISVNLDKPVIDVKDGNHVDVRFLQSFSSDIYRESGKAKTLSLEKQLGHWKIVAEFTGNAPKPQAANLAASTRTPAPLPVTRAETEQIEAVKAKAAKEEAERIETERLEAAKAQAIRLEARKVEAANAEAARIEAERARNSLETAKTEAAKAEAARAEAAKAEALRAENARKEAAKSAEAAKEAAVKARRDCLMSRKCREETAKLEEEHALKTGTTKPAPRPEAETTIATPTETKDQGPEVWKAVESWATDWQAKDAKKFLKHYERQFTPEDGSTYAAWEKRRRDHFDRVKKIEVALSNASVEVTDNNHATVNFTQDFRADNYHQVSNKTLVMHLTPTGWLISAEHSMPSKEEAAKAEAARAQALKAEAERNEARKAEAARAEAARAEAARLKAEEASRQHAAKVEVAKVEAPSQPPVIKAEVVNIKTATQDQSSQTDPAVHAVKAWAQAWEAKDVDGYLAYYSSDFKPAGGESLAAWELQRRARITKARSISVKLEGLTAKLLDDHHAQVSFTQHYRAENYQDVTRKVLDMVRNEQGWQITQERVDATPAPASTAKSTKGKSRH